MPRPAALALSALLTFFGLALIADHQLGTTGPEVFLETGALPSAVAPVEPTPRPLPVAPAAGRTAPSTAPPPTPAPPPAADQSGVPAQIVIPFPSAHHPHGVTAPVSADPLTDNGDLYVPQDPRIVSWASDDAAPGARRGTAILVGHVNNVVDGRLVQGAFADLAEYAVTAVGETFTVVLADGRQLTYEVVGGRQYSKEQLAEQPELRQELYDQVSAFGPGRGTGRLVLVSCGGAYDKSTGEYEDNVFLYAMPVEEQVVEHPHP
jgi:hypothetical protein